jgi:hypothetical protein
VPPTGVEETEPETFIVAGQFVIAAETDPLIPGVPVI